MSGIKVADFKTVLEMLKQRSGWNSAIISLESDSLKRVFAQAAHEVGQRAVVEAGNFYEAEICMPGRGYTFKLRGERELKISDKGAYQKLQELLSVYVESRKIGDGINGSRL